MRPKIPTPLYLFATIFAIAVGCCLTTTQANAQSESNRKRLTTQFSASAAAIVFPVPVGNEAVGLIFIDRATSQRRLIAEDKVFLFSPHLSQDGKRLIFVRRTKESDTRELLTCETGDWHCRALLRTTATIMSPIEVEKNTILYSSSPVIREPNSRVRYNEHDFYLLNDRSQPVRLSNFRFYELGSINLTGRRLIFAAVGPARDSPVIPRFDALADPNSEIYELEFDLSERRIRPPSRTLTPLFLIKGYSAQPSVSADGKQISFLNRRSRGKGAGFQYNLVIATLDGAVQKYIEASGAGFSRPVFVGNTVLVNEPLDDRYQIKLFDLSTDTSQVLTTLGYASQSLKDLERINLAVAP